jgi:MFS family permease
MTGAPPTVDSSDRPPGRGALWQMLRALRHRNYRLFFMGQGVSLIGTWMQRVAQGWLVYQLTHSEFMLGVVGFSGQIMTFLLSPLAGVLADRYDRRWMLILTQVLAMLQAGALAVLTLGGWITAWQIVVLSLLMGLINAFDIPIRQSFIVEMLDRREDLPNAIALNSFMFNGARLIGPTVAGFLIAEVGEGLCFLLNSASFLFVITALVAMRVVPRPVEVRRRPVLHHLVEGARYAFGSGPIRDILLLLAVMNLVGLPYIVLMPALAQNLLHGGAETLGLMFSASGVGAILGATYLASRKSVLGLGRVIALNIGAFGVALIALSWVGDLWVAMPLLVIVGFCMMTLLASCNTLIQTIVEEDKRGRVMGFYTMSFMGVAPFGSLLAGGIAGAIGGGLGVAWTITLGGAGCLLVCLFFTARLPGMGKRIHPIYMKLGIVPPSDGDGLDIPPSELRV